MEQPRNCDCHLYSSVQPGNEELESTSQGFMPDHSSCLNSNRRPHEIRISEAKPVLNYSIQTGEEFEFMLDRVNPKQPFIPNTARDPNYTAGYSELKGMLGVSHTGSESGSDISMISAVEEKSRKDFERKNSSLYEHKSSYGSVQSVPRTSSDQSIYHGTLQEYASSGASEGSSTKIKVLCSFEGRILPRPRDGKLRYVGGETRIVRIRKDITWQELWQKAITIYNQTHSVKYQLPGEDLDALVSVSCDEDLHNMMEECNLLQDGEGSNRLRMFLFSLRDLQDAHFGLQNYDGDPEFQYVVAVNGMDVGSRKNSTLHGLASSSGNNLDELDRENVERDTGGATTDYGEVGTSPLTSYMISSSQSSQPIPPPFSSPYETHSQFYNGEMLHHVEAMLYPTPYVYNMNPPNYSPFGESSGLQPVHEIATQQKAEGQPSSVLCMHDSQMQVKELKQRSDVSIRQKGGDESTLSSSKYYHIPSQPVDGNLRDYFPAEEVSAVISTPEEEPKTSRSGGRHQESVQVSSPLCDVNPVQVPKADTSNGAFTPGYGNSESDPIDLGYLEPPLPPQRVFYSERIPREQAELLNRLSKSDDSHGSQFHHTNNSHCDVPQQGLVVEPVPPQTEQPISTKKPLHEDPHTIADGASQFKNLKQAVSKPFDDDEYASNEDRILKDENETNSMKEEDKNLLTGETPEVGSEFLAASLMASVSHQESSENGLPESQWRGEADSNFAVNRTQRDKQDSAWIESFREPSVGVSRPEGGDILIDINDRFPRDFLSDIFSKALLSEGSSGISPLQKDGAGLSLNIENQDPKHWSYFQKLAGGEFAQKDVSLIDQDHFGFSSGLPKVEEEAAISYKFSSFPTDDISLSHVDSQMNYDDDDQNDLTGTVGADTIALHLYYDSSQLKDSELMQFDNFEENEVLNGGLK